jgi:hypothetical protein
MAAVANDLLTQYGQSVAFVRNTKSVDPVSGVATVTATSTASGSCIVLPASKGTLEAFDNRLESGSLAGKDLRYVKVAAEDLTFEPRPMDVATFAGADWLVLGCTPVNPAGTALVYGVGVVKL